MIELVERVRVRAPVERAWTALTDWAGQGRWMFATTVRLASGDGVSVGSRLIAFTGWGPFAFSDPMEITDWDPPRRCEVTHTGDVVRGTGVFEVVACTDGRSECVWTERLHLPFGVVGKAGWLVAEPLFRAGVRLSLRRFASHVEGGT